MDNVKSVEFTLDISRQVYLQYYSGRIKSVIVRSTEGRRVQFPANLLTSHVTHSGVKGLFVLHYLENGKALSLDKIN